MARFMLLGNAAVGCAILLAACTVQAPAGNGSNATAQTGDAATDTQAIGAANENWLKLIRAKDANAIAQMYAGDGALMPPNAPIAKTPDAIRSTWQSMLQSPGFDLNFRTETLALSASGDMALDRGTYTVAMNSPKGTVQDSGKYVVVWRKVGGQWKVAADIFNSNQPAG